MSRHLNTIIAVTVSMVAAGVAQAVDPCGLPEFVESPNPGSGHQGLRGVASAAPDDVWAIGSSGSGPIMIRWDGGAWNEESFPSDLNQFSDGWDIDVIGSFVPDQVWLAGVGQTGAWTNEQVLVRWNGNSWGNIENLELLPQTVHPFAPRYGAPNDIAGTGPDDVWIVGSASGWGDGVGGSVPMVVEWDGSELIEHLGQVMPGNRQNHFYGVAALAPDDVWAVGYYNNTGQYGGAFRSMVQHWDGSRWTFIMHPTATVNQSFLYDIVAIAPDDIWAVGEMPGGALLMHYNGTSWSLADSPTSTTTRVQKIEAIASDDVWATTAFNPGYLHWNGTSWTVEGANEVPGASSVNRGGGLAVSGDCDMWSVGGMTVDGFQRTLTEHLSVGGIPGDVDGDGIVNFQDILAVLAAWGPCQGCPADLDGDGVVGFADLLIVLANWS